MKLWILVLTIILCLDAVLSKSSEKLHRKKGTTSKKKIVKSPKPITDVFRNLSLEDLDFIKELDKQFKLHGNNIKFKVERVNGTSKNSKRTIDGELGYGYYNQHQNPLSYQFSQPKYMIYPYSQHDIPAASPNHGGSYGNTIVSVQPSQSFEIKDQSDHYNSNGYYNHPDQYGYEPYEPVNTFYAEPVIVLRIPGPQKYAMHLQALLQQYLEIRAAQYIRALQETQHHYQQEYQQQYEPEEQREHAEELYRTPVNEVYQDYQYRHPEKQQPQHEQHLQNQQQPQHQNQQHKLVYETPQGDSNSYRHNSNAQNVPEYEYSHGGGQDSYHPGFIYRTPLYDYETNHESPVPHTDYGAPHADHSEYTEEKSDLPISENYPSQTHTKVVFTDGGNNDHSTSYPLPCVGNAQKYEAGTKPEQLYDYMDSSYNGAEQVVDITQRPYNYHPDLAAKGIKRGASTAQEQMKRLNKLISRLRKNQQAAE